MQSIRSPRRAAPATDSQETPERQQSVRRGHLRTKQRGAPRARLLRGAEKEYRTAGTPAEGAVTVSGCACVEVRQTEDRRQGYQTPGLYVNPHFTPGASVDATPAAPEPVLPMDLARTRYSHSVTQVFSSLFSRPFSIQSGPLGLGLR